MRVLVVSDIHANLAAFEATLEKTGADRDVAVCLGDIVGYGPDPRECIALAAEHCAVVLGGNHDHAAGGVTDLSEFADHARRALEWTRPRLTAEDAAYLAKLPLETGFLDLLLCHGSPEDPLWGYIFSEADAEAAFAWEDFDRCFFGHTHQPSFFIQTGDSRGRVDCEGGYGRADQVVETKREHARFLLNPGSVGFPRDRDAHRYSRNSSAIAQYAIFDTETGLWQFKRLEYDIRDTAKRMRQQGLLSRRG
ncbi:MAG: metallophosphatase family protein [Treponema sp.]|jgi:predicted phosphodiesterase|nr:metallophosphatase family protein [Treponema sp.]